MKLGEPYIVGAFPEENQQTTDIQQVQLLKGDAFLKLFTTQLKHQDPMNPMEPYELASQLAQFSTVELLTKGNKYLEKGAQFLSSVNNLEAVNLLGFHIQGYTDLITVKDGHPVDLNFTLEDQGAVTINIYNEKGMMVKSIERGMLTPGEYELNWDGTDMYGKHVPDGDYKVEIRVQLPSGHEEVIYPKAEGQAGAIKFVSGLPYLVLNDKTGLKAPIGFIVQIDQQEKNSSETEQNPE
ncbi:MAG: hypothetical protein JRI45_12335 [Deltaproteobacteria bacterium]|nr:hypothetical protein [Deltaproteobacteria bacterium]